MEASLHFAPYSKGMYRTDNPRNHGWHTGHRLIPAVILIGIGVLFLFNNLNIFYFWEWARYWPVILIAIGLVKLVDSTFAGGRVAGAILIGLGAILLGQTLGYLNVRIHDLWPLFLIGAGLLMLWHRAPWYGSGNGSNVPFSSTGAVDHWAIFGGGKRAVTGRDFQGGHISTIFGGFELDLRQASMAADSAVLEIHTIFGGVEVRIPANWSAVVQGVGIFGGFGDNTAQPNVQDPGVKRLFVRGAAVFGGVGVKN